MSVKKFLLHPLRPTWISLDKSGYQFKKNQAAAHIQQATGLINGKSTALCFENRKFRQNHHAGGRMQIEDSPILQK
jgi:hypothetical protein